MKSLFFFLIIFGFNFQGFCQINDIWYQKAYFNPAHSGFENKHDLNARYYYLKLDPIKINYLAFNYNQRIEKINSGFGVSLDNLAFSNNNLFRNFSANYAYHLINDSLFKISLGVGSAFQVDYLKVNPVFLNFGTVLQYKKHSLQLTFRRLNFNKAKYDKEYTAIYEYALASNKDFDLKLGLSYMVNISINNLLFSPYFRYKTVWFNPAISIKNIIPQELIFKKYSSDESYYLVDQDYFDFKLFSLSAGVDLLDNYKIGLFYEQDKDNFETFGSSPKFGIVASYRIK